MDDFSKGFFDEFFGGIFADSPALAVIFVIVICLGGIILYANLKDK